MRRSKWFVAAMASLALVAVGCGDDSDGPALTGTAAPTTAEVTTTTDAPPDEIVVKAGINDPNDKTIAVLQYLPAAVTVEAGETVTWDWSGTIEPHSVTFLAPGQTLPEPGSDPNLFAPTPAQGPIDGTSFVNSGLLPLGTARVEPMTLTFSTPGTYEYFCVIHPQMIGEVEVVEAGDGADSPLAVAERAAEEGQGWLEEGRAAKHVWEAKKPPTTENEDGTTTYDIEMGTSTAHTDILAFQPTPVDLEPGDQIRFVNNSAAPHTASFFGEGAERIQNPLDPRVDRPAPGRSPQDLTSSGFYNTGLLPPNVPPGAGPPEEARSFVFTVPREGSYAYVCILHAASNMTGEVNVG
jgi:plastocyanin